MIGGTGFNEAEFRARCTLAQAAMAKHGLAALLLTTEPEIRYFTGFMTRFWESPTRPWFLILPAAGDPVAVIPAIGTHLMRQGWITDIRDWISPDYTDDGVSLLADALTERVPAGEAIGVPSGGETHLRMPLTSWDNLRARLPQHRFTSDHEIIRTLRMVKSAAEVASIATACRIAARAFARVPDIAGPNVPLSKVFRRFQMLCLDEGADCVPYLAGAAAPGGYGDVISPATDRLLQTGDVLMLDTGLQRNGYFCDFDRNFSIGQPDAALVAAHARLIEATQAGFAAARPGATPADLFAAMDRVLTGGIGGRDSGRLGHGLGMQLTEPPSLIPDDHTDLRPGMVLTLEPVLVLAPGRLIVHEENIVIEDSSARWLSPPAPASIQVIEA